MKGMCVLDSYGTSTRTRYRRSHWFNTVMMTSADLDREFHNNAMKKRYVSPLSRVQSMLRYMYRTISFAILGMSLSGAFDNTSSNDLLKSLLNILTEYEQSKEDNYKPKMVLVFASSKTDYLINS